MDRAQRLAEVARIAWRIEHETGLPAQLLIAQWALESRWGEKPAGKANYFGIKRAKRHQRYCTVPTQEVVGGKRITAALEFADYDSLEASCRDYAWLLTHGSPYQGAWRNYQLDGNLWLLILGVAAVYATDPQYADLLTKIASQANVAAALDEARHSEVGA